MLRMWFLCTIALQVQSMVRFKGLLTKMATRPVKFDKMRKRTETLMRHVL